MHPSIKRDLVKQKWEDADSTEFPLVCETCLGDNPYVRMTKEPHGKSCKICHNPFTVFAWQAGTKGRIKRVEICKTCAQTKNVCQVCIFDLQYGLPVQVRDKVLAQEGAASSSATRTLTAMPHSDANRAWFHAMNQRALESSPQSDTATATALISQDIGTLQATATLQSMARMEPRYQRNLPKLCSFFAKGECNRGPDCPFRHEMPRDRNDPLSKQNTIDRFYGSHDPVAMKMMNAPHRPKAQTGTSTSATYNQLRYGPNAPRGNNSNHNNNNTSTSTPIEEANHEQAVATLYVRFDTTASSSSSSPHAMVVTEQDLRDAFYSFGEIVSVRLHANLGAFIEYSSTEATELAILSMNRKWILHEQVRLLCNWARVPKRGSHLPTETVVGTRDKKTEPSIPVLGRPLPPPGTTSTSTTTMTTTLDSNSNHSSLFTTVSPSSLLLGVPRPEGRNLNHNTSSSGGAGGGPIKRPGLVLTQEVMNRVKLASQPYPSSDPSRLGSQS